MTELALDRVPKPTPAKWAMSGAVTSTASGVAASTRRASQIVDADDQRGAGRRRRGLLALGPFGRRLLAVGGHRENCSSTPAWARAATVSAPPATERNALLGEPGDDARHAVGATVERLDLRRSHRAVPEQGAAAVELALDLGHAVGDVPGIISSGLTASAGTVRFRAPDLELGRDRDIGQDDHDVVVGHENMIARWCRRDHRARRATCRPWCPGHWRKGVRPYRRR